MLEQFETAGLGSEIRSLRIPNLMQTWRISSQLSFQTPTWLSFIWEGGGVGKGGKVKIKNSKLNWVGRINSTHALVVKLNIQVLNVLTQIIVVIEYNPTNNEGKGEHM